MQTSLPRYGCLPSSLSWPLRRARAAPSCGTSEMYWFIVEHAVCWMGPLGGPARIPLLIREDPVRYARMVALNRTLGMAARGPIFGQPLPWRA